ncbi:hypothetical protein E8E14_006889 [Neopestalotiopsis sp. 37M]|nr:hypothetical protein E8E14_006889 [Neopestalotiopsis sp. 37M]
MAMMGNSSPLTYPRIFWVSSPDLENWSAPVWGDPFGIDPHLFSDPNSGKNYLTLMSLNNDYDRLWGIGQCEVDLVTGKCIGAFGNIWNGTLPVTTSTRPEGPKLFYKDPYYYLLIAEGGTGITHRATIARSDQPNGPWTASPTNPLIFNGVDTNLTIGATGHATMTDTPDGRWFATLLAYRYIGPNRWAIGRETFFAPVTWEDDWPTMNDGQVLLLSQSFDYGPNQTRPPPAYEDLFEGEELDSGWYQVRSPYTLNYRLKGVSQADIVSYAANSSAGVVLLPNAYTLSDRDTPSAILRKQKSLNMTFTATLSPIGEGLGPFQSVGVTAYVSDQNHHDIGVRGCANTTGLCIFVDSTVSSSGPGSRPTTIETPLNASALSEELDLVIRPNYLTYSLGFGRENGTTTWMQTFPSSDLPSGFDGAMFGLFASGNGFPWPYDAPDVGFNKIREEYYNDDLPDYIE